MAALSTTYLTLSDLRKGLDPNGMPARVIELLEQETPLAKDLMMAEANNGTTHRTTVRTGLASTTWAMINAGTQPSKGSKAQIDFPSGILESWSKVDERLVKLSGDVAAFRLSEAKPHVDAVVQEVESTLFYGNPNSPNEFVGLSAYYDDLDAGSGRNIIDAGGTGSDNCSIWFIDFDPDAIHGFYPKGLSGGLVHEDLGKQVDQNAAGVTGALMTVLIDKWSWSIGLAVKNWTKAVRIANIDVSDLTSETGAADLRKALIKAYHRIRNKKNVRIYMNPTCAEFMDIQGRDDGILSGFLGENTIDGEEVFTFRRIPIRETDALLETEARVTA